MRKRLLSILMLIGMLVLLIGPMAVPASASALITQERDPSPPAFLLNTGADTELFWWTVTFDTTPVLVTHNIYNPSNVIVHTHNFPIPGASSPYYNEEDPTGTHQGDGNPTFAHQALIPAGAAPGTYTSRVRFYSEEVLLGEQPNDTNWEAESALTFFVQQPWQVFKYNDLNKDGNYDPGEGEVGLDGWHFEVSGPGGYADSGNTSGGGFLVLDNAIVAGAYTVTETLLANWVNTDPGDNTPPITKTVNIPADLPSADPTVRFGNAQLVPDTIVTISANPNQLPDGGGPVTLVVTELNNGDLPLTSVHVDVTSSLPAPWNSFTLSKAGPNPAGTIFAGDTGNDGVLSANELWNWTIPNVMVTASTNFIAIGHGLDPSGADVTFNDAHPFERASVPVTVNPPVQLPSSTNTGIGILIGSFAIIMALFVYRRTRHSNQLS